MNRLRDLGLKQRLRLAPSTKASNARKSWEELKAAAKVASDEKAAAAAASDSCKRKLVAEPKAPMAQRLADDSRSSWTRQECESMTQVKLTERLRDLDLPGRLYVEVSTEASSAGKSWEELKAAAKVASDEKAAAAKVEKAATGASPSASRSPSLRWRWRSGWRMIVARPGR